MTAAPGCEKKPGLDSRPANKRVAIYIPFHDSAGLYERIHCVTSWRLEDRKGETTEETGEALRSLDSVQKQLFWAAAALLWQEEGFPLKE